MRNKRIDSDSCSDDDVPLKMMQMNGCTDPNSYGNLCRHSIEACEFCEKVSKNRYSSLIHNVSHIIIPLLNQSVVQCQTCLHHFTSEKDLIMHKLKKHPNLNTIPQVLVKKESIEISTNNLKRSESMERRFKNETNILQNGDLILNNTVRYDEIENDESKMESIKNRLVFEDDDVIILDCNQLLSDLTTDCKVNLEDFEAPWLNEDEFTGKSVHYNELVKPGFYRCKKCCKGFPTRYDAIIHESSHIQFRDSQVTHCAICRNFILGDRNNLLLHYMKMHKPYQESFIPTSKTIIFEEEKQESTEDRRTFDSKVLFLCELCFSFCKSSSYINYECIKNVSELGKRFQCEKCNQPFFEIKLVRRQIQRKMFNVTRKRKYTTKEERLKIIRKRLKLMNH